MAKKENKSLRFRISAMTIVLLLLATILVFPLFSENESYAKTTLQDSLVQNESGNWVSSDGKWNSRWANYNCYAFAIERFETPNTYSTDKQYQPGDMCQSQSNIDYQSANFIANIVKQDLVAIGYSESSILISTTLPTISNNQELICVRTAIPSLFNGWDYHFMRYDSKTNAWYHKPGPTAVLKYKYTPSNNRNWTN